MPNRHRHELPDDFPPRLGRLWEASGLSWRGFARVLGVNVRSLYRWRAGAIPADTHIMALLTFASERDLLDCLIGDGEQAGSDERQAVLFNLDEQV